MKRATKLIGMTLLLALIFTSCSKSKQTGDKVNVFMTDSETSSNQEVGANNQKENQNTKEEETKNEGQINDKDAENSSQALPQGVTQLLQVKFTAKKQAIPEDITEYYSSMEEKNKVTKKKSIPSRLTDLLIKTMNQADGETSVETMLNKNEISQEKCMKLTGISVADDGSIVTIQADGDNDGIDDLIVMNYGGGSGGFSELEFYKGNSEGTYTQTNSYSCMDTVFGVLTQEGSNYIVMKEFNDETKCYNGYSVLLYEGGKLADAKKITIEATDYDMEVLQEDDTFSGIEEVKKTLCKKNYPSILKNSNLVIYGTAEQVHEGEEYEYTCDIDNDGVEEYYNKYMWLPSTMGRIMYLENEFKDSTIVPEIRSTIVENDTLYAIWFDKVVDKNITYMYYSDDLDYTLYAYLIQK
jgi:hypothetical protein